MTTYVTANLYTNAGENHIFTVASGDGAYVELLDLITGQGLGSLQGQTITHAQVWTDNYVIDGAGLVIVDPQNIPVASLPVTRIEENQPMWQSCRIGPINLNWKAQVYTSASVA